MDNLDLKIQKLKENIRDGDYERLIFYAFELACYEADYLGVPKEGQPFKKLCLFRKIIVIENVYVAVRDSIIYSDDVCVLEFPTKPEEYVLRVQQLYR